MEQKQIDEVDRYGGEKKGARHVLLDTESERRVSGKTCKERIWSFGSGCWSVK